MGAPNVGRAGLAILTALLGCADDRPTTPTVVGATNVERRPLAFVDITIQPGGRDDVSVSSSALVGALFEVGLIDLDGVVPIVSGSTAAPSLRWSVDPSSDRFDARIDVTVGGNIDATLTICRDFECATDRASAARDRPELVAEKLLVAAAEQLERSVTQEAVRAWSAPPSRDAYALLVAGRAAAQLYGLAPRTIARANDPRRDPIARAIFLDPNLAVAQWIAGRAAPPEAASTHFELARRSDPTRIAYLADTATALGTNARTAHLSRMVWEDLVRRRPDDLRFVLARARSALVAERAVEATALLDAAPPRVSGTSEALELRVAALDAQRIPAPDSLLLAWAEAAPTSPEPIRRRLQLYVLQDDYAAALDIAAELGRRGAGDEALRVTLAAALASRRWSEAANAAQRLGKSELATRIAVREELDARRAVQPESIAWTDRRARNLRARVELPTDPAAALRTLGAPTGYDVPALTIAVRAHRARQDRAAEEAALRRLLLVDPLAAEQLGAHLERATARLGSTTSTTQRSIVAPGKTGAGTQSQSAPP